MHQPRLALAFDTTVIEHFSYLRQLGFDVVQRDPTLVRYLHQEVEVDIYHGRQSFEIGVGVAIGGERFSLSELIRVFDNEVADSYRNPVAADIAEVVAGVARVATILRQFGLPALRGESDVVTALNAQRREWLDAYALDVLTEQTRPLAEQAFRSGDYSKATELYSRIYSRLTAAEKGKLKFSEARSAKRH